MCHLMTNICLNFMIDVWWFRYCNVIPSGFDAGSK